ncbi:MAG: hypothetical protein Q8L36_01750 [bacterium]|nr:hypothetical protein [bacterium]
MVKKIKKVSRPISSKKDDVVIREIFGLREHMDVRMDNLERKFDRLQTAVDGYAHKADKYFQEMIALNNRVNRLERWIEQIAEKLDLDLKS